MGPSGVCTVFERAGNTGISSPPEKSCKSSLLCSVARWFVNSGKLC